MNSAIQSEEDALLAFQVDASLSIATHRLNTQIGLNDDIADRGNLVLEDSSFLASANLQIAASISTFIAAENAREVTEAASLTSVSASFSTAVSANITSALSAEITRAHLASSTAVRAVITRPQNATGALDNLNCTSSEAGTVYFSWAKRQWHVCNGNRWSWIMPNWRIFSQLGGNIVNLNQETNLREYFPGGIRYELCYSLARDGSSSTTFHTNCDGVGPTLLIAQNTNGFIFGGYNEHGWANTNTYYCSSQNMLYRFVGDNIQYVLHQGVSCNSVYNHGSQGPCFGACDWWVQSDMRNHNSCSNNFGGPSWGYGSTWLFQTGSTGTTVSKFEVYRRVL